MKSSPSRLLVTLFATGLAAVACLSVVALAQPASGPSDGPGAGPGAGQSGLRERLRERMDEGAPDAATLKQRLQRRLEENQKLTDRLKTAIEKLEKGGDTGDILRDLDLGRPDGGRGRDGGPARDGGPGGLGGGPGAGMGGGPGAGPGGRPGEGGPPAGPLSATEREEIHRFIDKHMPQMAERMKSFASLEPDAAERMTMRMAPRFRELMTLEKREPKLFTHRLDEMRAGFEIIALSRELSDLVRSKGSEQAIAAAEKNVKDAVRARVEAQMKGQEAEIEALANRVQSLREQLRERTASKEDRITEESSRVIERARDPENRGSRGRGRDGGQDGGKSDEPPNQKR